MLHAIGILGQHVSRRVAQFSWHSWVSLPHEFKSSTKTNLLVESVIFLTETESQRIQKITST